MVTKTRMDFADFSILMKIRVQPKQYQNCRKRRRIGRCCQVLRGHTETLILRIYLEKGITVVAFSCLAFFSFFCLTFDVIF